MSEPDVTSTLDEQLAEQTRAASLRKASWSRTVSVVMLLVGIGMLLTGRSLVGHLIGYLSTAILAPSTMSHATRLRASVDTEDEPTRRVLLVVAFNLLVCVLGLIHAAYLARRFW